MHIMPIAGRTSATAAIEPISVAHWKVYFPRIVVPKPTSPIITAVGWRSASAPTLPL